MSEAADLLEASAAKQQASPRRLSAIDLLEQSASGVPTEQLVKAPATRAPAFSVTEEMPLVTGKGLADVGRAVAGGVAGIAENAIPALQSLYAEPLAWGAKQIAMAEQAVGIQPSGTPEQVQQGVRDMLMRRPTTPTGQFIEHAMGSAMQPVADSARWWGDRLDSIPGVGPGLRNIAEGAIAVAPAAGVVRDATLPLRAATERLPEPLPKVETPAVARRQNMGAAMADLEPERLAKLPPEIQKELQQAHQAGDINLDAANRVIDSGSLPVPVPLTRGEISGDADLISRERNNRGRVKGAPEFYDNRNQALIQNMDEIRAQAAPEVVHRDSLQNGQALIDAYKEMDAPIAAQIDADYQAMRDAAGGEFPIDTGALLANVQKALKKDLATSKAPGDVMAALQEAAEAGGMSFETFEGLRTSLARIARSSADGQERHAAGVIRNQIEELPMQPGTSADLKALADKARSGYRARQARIDADPAYKAALEDGVEVGQLSPEADRFIAKYVTGGKAAHIERMKANLSGNEEVPQILSVSALNQLRKAAGIKDVQSKFNQASYNNALRDLLPKMEYLTTPEISELAQQLGRVANVTQFQKEGSFINNSNTYVAQAAEGAKSVAAGIGDKIIPGANLGTTTRQKLENRAVEREWQQSIRPGSKSRISSLLDVGKEKKK